MTTKIISTIYSSGYTLATTYSGLDITSAGGVGGKGLTLSATASVVNNGNISSSAAGLTANGGLTLVNGSASDTSASISGYSAGLTALKSTATVTNFGAILGSGKAKGIGMGLEYGGAVTNGAASDTSASIIGYLGGIQAGGSTKLVNFGRIDGYLGGAVYLEVGEASPTARRSVSRPPSMATPPWRAAPRRSRSPFTSSRPTGQRRRPSPWSAVAR